MLVEVLSFLPGNFIVHRIGLTNKRFRQVSMELSPINKDRVVVLKHINQ